MLAPDHFDVLQYGRSFDDLDRRSHRPLHAARWRDVFQRMRTCDDFGIDHETEPAPCARVESIVLNCRLVDLAAFGIPGEPAGPVTTGRARLGRRGLREVRAAFPSREVCMASATEPKTPTPEVTASTMPGVPLYLLTVEQYHAMARAGILTEGDRVELLDGVLAAKTTKNPPHVIATKLAAIELSRVLPSGWHLAKEDPVVILPRSEPEPDLAVVRGAIRDYPDHNPSPTDVALLAEVADFSLDHERTAKLRIYARAGLPTYWIVNLTDRRVEVYTDPSGSADEPTYWRREDFGPGAAVPLVLDGREVARIAVGDLLP